jgi:hypothetical protein
MLGKMGAGEDADRTARRRPYMRSRTTEHGAGGVHTRAQEPQSTTRAASKLVLENLGQSLYQRMFYLVVIRLRQSEDRTILSNLIPEQTKECHGLGLQLS